MPAKYPEGLSHLKKAPVEAEIPADLQAQFDALFEEQQSVFGFVPNMFKVLPLNPHMFQGWLSFIKPLLFDPNVGYLDFVEKEMMGLVVSAVNKCHLCLTVHSDTLRGLTRDQAWVEQLGYNYRSVKLTARQRALADYAYLITTRPEEVEGKHLDSLRAVGLNEHEVLEAVFVAAYFNFSNRFATALGIKANAEHFASNRNSAAPA